jgi:4-diphosphocytidyl-2-C-methyl-D-erythritol kinase
MFTCVRSLITSAVQTLSTSVRQEEHNEYASSRPPSGGAPLWVLAELDSGSRGRKLVGMRLLCPAKINLHLRVGPRREDGFHPLLSWFCTAGLFDTLTLERSPQAGDRVTQDAKSIIALSCDEAAVPCDERNLVVRVAQAWALEARQLALGDIGPVTAALSKRIPAGAGLGGGSSDGARALEGLNALWNTGRAADFLSGFAARFGSDLPFFFHGPSSICSGRGEIVRRAPKPAAGWALIVLPAVVMPTPDVYRRFDEMGLGVSQDIEIEPDWEAWANLEAIDLLAELVNDLEPSAFAIAPELRALRDGIEKTLGRPVRMSGSGSSLFTLFDSNAEARAARTAVEHVHCVRCHAVEVAPVLQDDLNAGHGEK